MRVLHVGWGFQPFRSGGLIEYAEDLMEIQVKNGYQVNYFCTGRSSIFLNKPTLKRWKSIKGFNVFELKNPPIISGLDKGVDKPLWDLHEPVTEAVFLEVVNEVKPELVHFQEFIGIPTAVITKLKSLNIKTIFTVEDYFTVCPILKLVKSDNQLCKINDDSLGMECAKCCIDAPVNGTFYKIKVSFRHFFGDNMRRKLLSFIKTIKSARNQTKIDITSYDKDIPLQLNYKSEAFNLRRRSNLAALQQIDLIIAMSNKVATILNYYQPMQNITVLHLTLNHIEKINYERFTIGREITFGLINVMGSNLLKGKKLVLALFEHIANSSFKNDVKFKLLGNVDGADKMLLETYPFVEVIGTYNVKDLDQILSSLSINVAIIPSLWEEAYGYVGVEFLAKGIPVIGNNIGGIPDYVINDETGWLNNSCSSEELISIIEGIVANPSKVEKLNNNLCVNRNKYIKSFINHFHEMDIVYKELLHGLSVSELSIVN